MPGMTADRQQCFYGPHISPVRAAIDKIGPRKNDGGGPQEIHAHQVIVV